MMTDGMDRDELIGLLGQLGDENDQTVLSAARAIHAKVTAAGQPWDILLARPSAEPAVDAGDESAAPPAAGPAPDDVESLRLIDRLLEAKDVSEELRRELDDYKADIAAGEFGGDDRRYLKALYQRLARD